jgi:dipeptidyl-peptidase-4
MQRRAGQPVSVYRTLSRNAAACTTPASQQGNFFIFTAPNTKPMNRNYLSPAILLFAFYLIPLFSSAQQLKKDITLDDLYKNYTFTGAQFFPPESMKDGVHFTQLQYNDNYGEVVKYDYKTYQQSGVVVSGKDLDPDGKKQGIGIQGYMFSPDESKLLIWDGTEQIYRHSTRENYYIYDIKTKKCWPLSPEGKQSYARFSPDGGKVAFVRDNNIFIKDLSSAKGEQQITTDGKVNSIINGATDWVYEEEFTMDIGYTWSPDGNRLAYYRFDESRVKEFNLIEYGTLYPSEHRYKYPKAGEENSVVDIYVYDLKAKKAGKIDLGNNPDSYVPRVIWTKDANVLSVQKMNRLQNTLDLYLVTFDDKGGSTSNVIMTEKSDTYIEIQDHLTFLDNKKQFIWSSEKGGFLHFYLYDMSGKLVNQVTTGNWEIVDLKGIDEKAGLLYYISAESSPMERDLYCIKLDGTGKKKLSAMKGTNNAYFSEGMKYYIEFHSDANTPTLVTLHTADGKQLKVLEDNAKLKEKMAGFNLSKKEFFTFKTSEGVELNGWMIKPPAFDPNKKYPVFMTVYGGPGSNTVNDAWEGGNYFWHQMLAEKGYIVVSVDNRGTGFRGYEFKHCAYRQLGKLETMDQIETAKYLGSLPYVDKTRIGIQGWSYGGYMSSLCITKGAEFFKMAIAVAPVTNWRFYDSIYTERYMGLPSENASGYDDNSPVNHVKELKGKYLLIHGTADDNVHFQNSVEMTTALIKANKQFDSFYYPDKNHGIYGGNTRLHLYTMMTNYIMNNL